MSFIPSDFDTPLDDNCVIHALIPHNIVFEVAKNDMLGNPNWLALTQAKKEKYERGTERVRMLQGMQYLIRFEQHRIAWLQNRLKETLTLYTTAVKLIVPTHSKYWYLTDTIAKLEEWIAACKAKNQLYWQLDNDTQKWIDIYCEVLNSIM